MDPINNACKLGSDAWLELQAFKTRQLNRREKLNRHKDLINEISLNRSQGHSSNPLTSQINQSSGQPSTSRTNHTNICETLSTTDRQSTKLSEPKSSQNEESGETDCTKQNAECNSNCTKTPEIPSPMVILDQEYCSFESERVFLNLDLVECLLILKLCDVALKLPIDSRSLQRSINNVKGLENTPQTVIENLLQKFAHQELISIEEPSATLFKPRNTLVNCRGLSPDGTEDDELCIHVTSADHTKLVEFDKSFGSLHNIRGLLEAKTDEPDSGEEGDPISVHGIRATVNPRDRDEIRDDIKPNLESNDTEKLDKLGHQQSNSSKSSFNIIGAKSQPIGDDVESLLSLSSTRERASKKLGEELLELLSKPTAKERNLLESFRSADGYQVQEFCPKGTKGECKRNNKDSVVCDKLHFKKIIAKHTEESLGDCSFLNTCFHMDSCKYVHYEVDYSNKPSQCKIFRRPYPAGPHGANNNLIHKAKHDPNNANEPSPLSTNDIKNYSDNISDSTQIPGAIAPKYSVSLTKSNSVEQTKIDLKNMKRFKNILCPPQWIQCDLRFFDMSLLGKFSVVMADPPWDIHMELPYGTMSDDEMRKLNIPALQDEGVIFLWVTGRAMELGRECLALWGYERCDEIIWVKTNQLQRIIRTGRTGHWLNHGKEHCLVGVKGNPKDINRGIDCDVIVAEVRATSHKPDEIYGIIERLSPGTRKIELFGRAHNVQPNWITLGNQLNGVRLIEQNLINAFKKNNLPFQTADDTI